MHFASDNTGPVHPKVMEALFRANDGHAPGYGADPITLAVQEQVRAIFEAPQAAVYLVGTGTAANVLTLASMTRPWDTIFCADISHLHEDECNAPEFYTGAKLTLIATENARITPQGLRKAVLKEGTRGVHGPQRGPVSITQATEKGTVYALAEIAALTAEARSHGLKTHMDGARFSNGLAHLGCSAADMTWRAGIDALSFGGTKNGLMGVEAVVIFDSSLAWEFELRRKRGGHLTSKGRYLAAQMQAYLTDDLWLDMARSANEATARLAAGLGRLPWVELLYPPQANIIFARIPRSVHEQAQAAGAVYYTWDEPGDADETAVARFVCDWSMTAGTVDAFLAVLSAPPKG